MNFTGLDMDSVIYQTTAIPVIDGIATLPNGTRIRASGDYLHYATQTPTPLEQIIRAYEAGVLNINEARVMAGYPPIQFHLDEPSPRHHWEKEGF